MIGSSPEELVRLENGTASIAPIAGTRPRGKTPEEDRDLEAELVSDPKERAEHMMLVDLANKQDGTQYMENIKGYISVYNLDIIKTADKIIIENQEGKSIEKPADFDLGKEAKLLNDNTVVLTNDKKFIVINMNDLSMKELDFSTARSAYVEEGYIMTYGTGSTREYYNANGDKIYTYKE